MNEKDEEESCGCCVRSCCYSRRCSSCCCCCCYLYRNNKLPDSSIVQTNQFRCRKNHLKTNIHTNCCGTKDSASVARTKVSSDKLQSAFNSSGGSEINEQSKRKRFRASCSQFCCQTVVCSSQKLQLLVDAPQRAWSPNEIAMQEEIETNKQPEANVEQDNGLQLERSQRVKAKTKVGEEEEINVGEKRDSKRSGKGEELNLVGVGRSRSCGRSHDGLQGHMMVKEDVMQLHAPIARGPLVYVAKYSKGRRKDIYSSHNSYLLPILFLLVTTTLSIINHRDSYQLLEKRSVDINTEEKVLHKDNNYNGHFSDDKRQWPLFRHKTFSSRLNTYLRFPTFQLAQAALIEPSQQHQLQHEHQQQKPLHQQQAASINLKMSVSKVEQKNELANKSALPENFIATSATSTHQDQTKSRPLTNTKLTNKLIVASPKLLRTISTLPASLNWKDQQNNSFGNGKKRNQNSFLVVKSEDDSENNAQNSEIPAFNNSSSSSDNSKQLQISITSRLSLIRVPVESNAILKCLISSQADKFTRKFNVHWSRYMYDENVYEQIESFYGPESIPGNSNEFNHPLGSGSQPSQEGPNSNESVVSNGNGSGNDEAEDRPLNRQQQLRDFLSRSRQEINVINELLIEATLSISPVKASDNASYYCTATDGLSDQKARIDLVALSKPIVQLDRVYPARDSKSALIYWIIISDGNAPIKKTILMVKNDTIPNKMQSGESSSTNSFIPISVPKQESNIETQQQQQYSSVVIDSDYNQWQRIEIADDGEEISAEQMMMTSQSVPNLSKSWSLYDLNANSMGGDNNVVSAADVDVVSSPIGQPNKNTPGDQDEFNIGSSSSSSSASSRSRWKLGRFHKRRRRSFNLTSLLPGVTYNLRLAAINDLGQSNWTQLVTTMPNDIPAQISEIFLLSRSNDSLTIGWRRPSYDGAKTIRYEMQLFDLNRTIEMNANTHTPPSIQGRNFMYIFVNLNPGTDYHFHIRACSKVGCSLFSSPKLLATTLDGEPDEPIDVELNCQYDSSNVTVSWLPPINTRGQLLNYSIQFDSYSKYKNSSGHWAVDEWRSTMETSDNHTLIFELGKVLMPNTNYSVRVCANNRSKHCGRLSTISPQAQCSTPPELPNDIPANIKLTTKNLNIVNNNNSAGDESSAILDNDELDEVVKLQKKKSSLELLLLELPFLSLRNGTINCIQVVLVRLPKAFDGDMSQLNQFLPNEPSDIKLSHLIDLFEYEQNKVKDNVRQNNKQQQKRQQQLIDGDKAVAYLAEEIEFINQIADNDTSTSANKSHNIMLGDGFQNSCQSLNNISILNENSNLILNNANSETSRAFRVFDGSLKAQTFYTGFIRLILIRSSDNLNNLEKQSTNEFQKQKFKSSRPAIMTKYSNYFNLVKTGDSVIEVPIPTNNDASTTGVHVANQFSQDSQMNIQDMADKLKTNLKTGINRLYNSTMRFISDKINVDSISDYIVHSTPIMQIFQVGMIVLILSLLILFALYLLLLPASTRRKRKKRMKKKQLKQQAFQQQQQQLLLQQGQKQKQEQEQEQEQEQLKLESIEQNYLIPNENEQQEDERQHTHQTNGLNQIVDDHNGKQTFISKVDYQQLDDGQVVKTGGQLYSGTTLRNHECPIHSSPIAKQQVCDMNVQLANRGPQVYQQIQSSQTPSMYQRDPAYGTVRNAHHHAHQHHSHYNHQLASNYTNQELARHEQYERNCRTTRRVSTGQNGYQLDLTTNAAGDMINLPYQQANMKNTYTLNQQTSVLALAKKISKSIPIRLFASVFECRLRNGWLREEYEQLPRQAIIVPPDHMTANNQQLKMMQSNNFFIKLQPQLVVVSKDDNNISALISGNDQYDASLIKIPMANDINEKRIICARSPLDADSVWDFWRLVYEQGVNTIVMLTQNEDQNTGEIRCAQYWPTCDNEETTILSPCNEYVQKSNILPAKFKIRQETYEDESRENDFKVRRLTLIVMATKPGENEQNEDGIQSVGGETVGNNADTNASAAAATPAEDDEEEELIIIERNITHLQFYHWNTSSLNNQMRLIKFIEMANERHSKTQQKDSRVFSQSGNQESNYDINGDNKKTVLNNSPMLVHCFNGIGRSGLFAALSFIIDDLTIKLNYEQQLLHHLHHHHHQQQISQQDKPLAKLNILQLVSRLRSQREMLLSPYRFYELLYQLTCNCITNVIATTATVSPNATTTDINNTVTNAAQEHPAQISARIVH